MSELLADRTFVRVVRRSAWRLAGVFFRVIVGCRVPVTVLMIVVTAMTVAAG